MKAVSLKQLLNTYRPVEALPTVGLFCVFCGWFYPDGSPDTVPVCLNCNEYKGLVDAYIGVCGHTIAVTDVFCEECV